MKVGDAKTVKCDEVWLPFFIIIAKMQLVHITIVSFHTDWIVDTFSATQSVVSKQMLTTNYTFVLS